MFGGGEITAKDLKPMVEACLGIQPNNFLPQESLDAIQIFIRLRQLFIRIAENVFHLLACGRACKEPAQCYLCRLTCREYVALVQSMISVSSLFQTCPDRARCRCKSQDVRPSPE